MLNGLNEPQGYSVSTQTADIASAIRHRLFERIGPQRFRVWFKNSTRFTLAGDFLKVGVANQFISGWIERHYAADLLASSRDVLGRDVQLSFAFEPSLTGNLHKTQLNRQAAQAGAGNGTHRPRHNGHNGHNGHEASVAVRRLRCRLDSFVVGPCNRLAYATIMDIAEMRPGAANPVFLHGGCGLGKTHLLHGVANSLEERTDNGRSIPWTYATGEVFTNQFLAALRHNQLDDFRRRFREAEVLLIDDVHFLANKKATQEEFLHTFNAIDMLGKRVVLASDAPPHMIGHFSEALISRFASGMVVRLDRPDHATRCNILRARAAAIGAAGRGCTIPDEVIAYIAQEVSSNVRELEGALIRVLALATMANAQMTLPLARQALEEHVRRAEPMLTAEQIETVVATFFGLTPAEMHTSRKTRTIALARSVAMYLTRKHTRLSYPEIARVMGNKNHSTVIQAVRRIQAVLKENGDVAWQSAAGPKQGNLCALLKRLEEQMPSTSRQVSLQ